MRNESAVLAAFLLLLAIGAYLLIGSPFRAAFTHAAVTPVVQPYAPYP